MLRIHALEKTFDDGTRALKGASFDVERGEFVVILGPSGSGKTTLLRSINGLVTPSAGTVEIDGRLVEARNLRTVRRQVGMIFQDFNLVGNLSVLNNVLSGVLDECGSFASLLYLFNRNHKLTALESLDRVGLLAKAYARADQLSGGQQQRVGIARAIVKSPLLLLADEPVASLDPLIAFNVLSLLKEISSAKKITVVCNLHQVDLALVFADRIIGLAEGRTIMDMPASSVDQDYIRNIYHGHDQGMFFGPGREPPPLGANVPLVS